VTQQVEFYVLEDAQEPARLALACRIADKAFQQGMEIYLQTETEAQATELDKLLWSYPATGFLPHEVYAADAKIGAQTKVLLGHTDPPEGWNQILISLTEAIPNAAPSFARVADLIGGDEQQKNFGRQRFRDYRVRGIEPITHRV